MGEVMEGALGVGVVLWVLNDIFQSVVVPRPTPGLRPSTVIARAGWPLWRALGLRRTAVARDRFLGQFASLLVVGILGVWIAGLILGYGLVLHALRAQLHPTPVGFGDALYLAAASLLTVGFGDVVAAGPAARVAAILAAASGLGAVALSISFIFSLFASFQRREALVVTLDERAGAPPSGVQLLETMAHEGLRDDLGGLFSDWERWSGEVLDTHVSYPVLAYFRSTHDNESWVSAIGAMLDAATLVATTVDGGPRGSARMLWSAGDHLVEDLARSFGFAATEDVGIERAEFDAARARLARAGYRLREADASWSAFGEMRAAYATRLNALARHFATPPSPWVGDRSVLRIARPHA
ncbi:MAG: hypothetical protein KGK34_01470 [Chloroflexota bacterium]|nr:hypothetical protein [Chloroflexota bacterium]